MRTNGRTDMTKVTSAFRDYAKGPKDRSTRKKICVCVCVYVCVCVCETLSPAKIMLKLAWGGKMWAPPFLT